MAPSGPPGTLLEDCLRVWKSGAIRELVASCAGAYDSGLVGPRLHDVATGGVRDSFVLLPRILGCRGSFARAFLPGRLVIFRGHREQGGLCLVALGSPPNLDAGRTATCRRTLLALKTLDTTQLSCHTLPRPQESQEAPSPRPSPQHVRTTHKTHTQHNIHTPQHNPSAFHRTKPNKKALILLFKIKCCFV